MSGSGNVLSGKYPPGESSGRGNFQSDGCPVGEIATRGNVKSGKCRSGKCPVTIATKLLELLHDNLDLLKLPKIIKVAIKRLKSFVLRGKKDGENQNDSKTGA